LIKDGVLTDYMWDHIRAGKEGRAPSGNGRRQSYEHLPMVRMTNTFVLKRNARDRRCTREYLSRESVQHLLHSVHQVQP